jgi:hypothetical protein
MREYSAFAPTFWTGDTGRAIKARGRDAVVLAAYLFTGPSATMLGIYYLPLPTLCHEAGFTPEEARATLADLAAEDFAFYDQAAELVWLPTMARWQVGPSLKPGDNRRKGIERQIRPFLGHKYGREFLRRYGRAYSLTVKAKPKGLRRGSQDPPKPGTGTGSGAGTGSGTGAGETTPPNPPASAGGGGLDPVGGSRGHGPNGHGAGLRGPDLEDAVAGLVAHWRRLGSFDPMSATGWGDGPVTVPREENVRAWRRALRTGRVNVGEFREAITNRVHGELLRLGKITGDETWPPHYEGETL